MALYLRGDTVVAECGKTLLELNEQVTYLLQGGNGDSVPIDSIFEYDGEEVPEGYVQLPSLVDMIYPVGSIYMSANEVNPETLFPGSKWERIKDTFLLAAGDKYELGATGGDEEVTLTVAQMPQHRHSIGTRAVYTGGGSYNAHTSSDDATNTSAANCQYVGGSKPHNNMPPYLAVYVWKRTE